MIHGTGVLVPPRKGYKDQDQGVRISQAAGDAPRTQCARSFLSRLRRCLLVLGCDPGDLHRRRSVGPSDCRGRCVPDTREGQQRCAQGRKTEVAVCTHRHRHRVYLFGKRDFVHYHLLEVILETQRGFTRRCKNMK